MQLATLSDINNFTLFSVCGGQPGFIAMKPEPDADDQVSNEPQLKII